MITMPKKTIMRSRTQETGTRIAQLGTLMKLAAMPAPQESAKMLLGTKELPRD